MPTTGRKISFSATDSYRVVNDCLVEEWNSLDGHDIVRQREAPEPASRSAAHRLVIHLVRRQAQVASALDRACRSVRRE